jgi:uncharacterized membrane protein
MPKVEASTTIKAPLEEVYEKTASPQTGPIFIPNLNENSDISPEKTQVGQTWNWFYNFCGFDIRGTAEVVAMEPNKSWSLVTRGAGESQWQYTFEPDGDGTSVRLAVDYEVPRSVLGKVAQPVIEQLNQRACRQALQNLKVWLES